MNVLTTKKKKLFICEVTTYIYEGERQTRMNVQERSNVPTFRGKPSLSRTEVVTERRKRMFILLFHFIQIFRYNFHRLKIIVN